MSRGLTIDVETVNNGTVSTTTLGYSAISSYSRVEILHLIQEQPQRTIAELVSATALHPNTVREHLGRLIDDGYVVSAPEHRTTRGRPRVLYSAADGTSASSPVQRRKVRDAAHRGDLMRRVMTVAVPDELGHDSLHQIDALVDELSDQGFDPIVDERALSLDLSECAYAESQEAHREVLCAVHLSLMQGVLAEAGGPLTIDGMRSDCAATQCIVRLLHAATTHD